ncbi:class I SAM-dependent methyltransferase [Pseudoalteromonas luteoviolacea]|uniref:Methyltransferase domain-containing protein n=1 Tax=Pseudoalteromonas luteoviolacea DSM 6061 TaxID=1365250 RepID=A0A166V2Q2_9GAMM|nr:class I SAM-dependent methyltransferase [Pseudoalteromonas luteoviolacea]KZN31651.1 hypothetical protein N475_04150 [Pseudoalteromonas luteoviolacea DSM 6061]MBE0388984.1 hypothetical protein [Pseudoalteromonas luteoviolacea DSM 6061]
MEYNSPLGPEAEQKLISLLNLESNSQVLEVGCGNGKFLHSLMAAYDASVIGVDVDQALIDRAIDGANNKFDKMRYQFLCRSFESSDFASHSYDLLICNGASHAFGVSETQLINVAEQAGTLLKKGGLFLLGECYWKKVPPQAYLDFLGQPVTIYNDYKGNIDLVKEQGFSIIFATSSSQTDWDSFEWTRKLIAKQDLRADPTNSQLSSKLVKIDTWLDAYLKWGREHLGFGFYLFEKNTDGV